MPLTAIIFGALLIFAIDASSAAPTASGDGPQTDGSVSVKNLTSCLEEKLLENGTITDVTDFLKKQLELIKVEEEVKDTDTEIKEAMAECQVDDNFDDSQAINLSLCILRTLNVTCAAVIPNNIYQRGEKT